MLKNSDERLAKQRVIQNFGDPVKIARQLWLDATKEKIMSQRIMTGISAVMAVCCIAVVGIAWSMMQDSRAFNLKMLEQFKLAQEKSASETSGELQPILFQLEQEGKDDQPAVGFAGTLSKGDDNNPIFTVEAVSDKNGLLDFGKLPWGNYILTLKAPWGAAPQAEQITTIPGRKYEQTIICPAHAPQDVQVEFQVNWEKMPDDQEYFLLCDFRFQQYDQSKILKEYKLSSFQVIGDQTWLYLHDLSLESRKNVYLIDVNNNQATPCTLAADGSIENLDLESISWSPTVEILQGQYRVPTIYLLQKNELSKLADINSIESIKAIRFYQNNFEIPEANYRLPFAGLIVSPFKKLEIEPSMVVNKPPSELKQIHGFIPDRSTHETYAATEKQPNVWKINIPDLFPITLESGSLSSDL
ncbi:prealbumin-like fold domain-containing protein [Gimesia sp.]|uniref:prealbumin-like fold domain-containing protein n=1 Tax=Gimesia sp. TaxID=2024833 RepID=UPI003A9216CD